MVRSSVLHHPQTLKTLPTILYPVFCQEFYGKGESYELFAGKCGVVMVSISLVT